MVGWRKRVSSLGRVKRNEGWRHESRRSQRVENLWTAKKLETLEFRITGILFFSTDVTVREICPGRRVNLSSHVDRVFRRVIPKFHRFRINQKVLNRRFARRRGNERKRKEKNRLLIWGISSRRYAGFPARRCETLGRRADAHACTCSRTNCRACNG